MTVISTLSVVLSAQIKLTVSGSCITSWCRYVIACFLVRIHTANTSPPAAAAAVDLVRRIVVLLHTPCLHLHICAQLV